MPVGYTALKTVASTESVADGNTETKGKKRRGHTAGNHGKCACCKQCGRVCGQFIQLSALTQCLIIAVVALFVVTGLLWIGGASLTGPASSNLHTDQLCYTQSHSAGSGREGLREKDDPTVPVLRQNVYAWYLANTGIVVTLTIFSSCVCCVSYVGLCCGLPTWAKILGAIGIAIVAITFSIYTVWMTGGLYLIIFTFDKLALFTSVCRNVVIYTVFLGVYLVVVVIVGAVWCVWRAREQRRRERSTPRQRHQTKPQLLRV